MTVLLALLQRAAELVNREKGPEASGLHSEEALAELASLLCHKASHLATPENVWQSS